MMPGRIGLSVIDLKRADPLDGTNRLLLRLHAAAAHTLVVNESLGYECYVEVTCWPEDEVRLWAAWWIQAVRSLGLENRFLHVVAAGNIEPPITSARDARTGATPAAAALLPDLVDASGAALPPLTNTLVAENARAHADPPFDGARCLSNGSFVHGNISAIGSTVWSFTGANAGVGNKSGTSMAAPQVAGLAAYMLAIRPDLKPQEIIGILRGTAIPLPVPGDEDCSDWPTPSPLIQAYEALLALDRANAGVEELPVRNALLDINGNGRFEAADLEEFSLLWETESGAIDFGRADLNNDRRTGGLWSRQFDLDVDGSIEQGVIQSIAGERRQFDETALTDQEIVCYYAYSALYSGDPVARDLQLAPYRANGSCGAVSLFAADAIMPARMMAGVPEKLVVTVTGPDGPVEGATIVVSADGGSAGGGTTDADGSMQSTATLDAGNSALIVTIRVFVGGELVGEVVKQAVAVLPATAGMFTGVFRHSNVSGATSVNFAGGYRLRPPGETLINNVNGNTFTYQWDTGYPPGTEGAALRMHRFTGSGSGRIIVELYLLGGDGLYMTTEFFEGDFLIQYHADGSPDSIPEIVGSNVPFMETAPVGNPGTIRLNPGGLYRLRVFPGPSSGGLSFGVVFTKDAVPPE